MFEHQAALLGNGDPMEQVGSSPGRGFSQQQNQVLVKIAVCQVLLKQRQQKWFENFSSGDLSVV